MHYKAVFGTPKPKQPKVYALYQGNNIVERGDYPLLVYKMKELKSQGIIGLKIKQVTK